MPLDSFLFVRADYHEILISVLLFIPVPVKSARLGSKLDREAIQLVSQILRLFLSFIFPDLISAIIPHISCFMFVPHSEITVRGALTLRQLFARYAFIGAYVHFLCSHV